MNRFLKVTNLNTVRSMTEAGQNSGVEAGVDRSCAAVSKSELAHSDMSTAEGVHGGSLIIGVMRDGDSRAADSGKMSDMPTHIGGAIPRALGELIGRDVRFTDKDCLAGSVFQVAHGDRVEPTTL